ncbi:MAG: polysaccharide biosynthesis tyrosine autokinase [Planctomycetota bacterium]
MPYEHSLVQQMPTEDQNEGLDLVGFLKRRKAFVIVLAMIGVGIGYMMFNRQIPQYRSDAQVQVIHRVTDSQIESRMAENDLADADFVIRSPKTLTAAYKNHGLSELALLRGLSEEDAVRTMAGMITTKAAGKNIVLISVVGSDPTEIRRIAQAAAEEYVLAQKGNYKDAAQEVRDILVSARDDFHEKFSDAEKQYSEFRGKSKLSADGENPFRARARQAFDKVHEFEVKKTELRAELAQLEAALSRGGEREAILLMIGKEAENAAVSATSTQAANESANSAKSMAQILFPMIQERSIKAAQLGPDHPKLRELDLQIDLTRKHFMEMMGADEHQSGEDASAQQNAPLDFLVVYLQSLRQNLLVLEKQQEEMQLLAQREDESARNLMIEELEDARLRKERDRLDKLFDELTLKISSMQVSEGMGGVTAQVLSPAVHGYLIYPVISQFIGLGGFLGAFAGLVLGYLVEMADRSFRKPEDIIREFGVPIIGHIPFITEQRLKSVSSESPMDKTAVSVHLPRSRPAEAYRAVRTAICFSVTGGSHRVLSVTSPAAGDGKSTLALNLALSLAQSGKKTILVEADFRRPKVHKLTGVYNTVGAVDVLRGKAEIADAIQESKIPDFSVLPCGTRPKNPAELLARPEFDQMLQVLRQKFDYVIVDTPPVLAVTDPCGVAARVDGVIVCMRLSRHTRDLGRRTVEQLRDVGAVISGIVVNGVEERDAYGYGNYRYSDYRYYYKNYNYKYGQYGSKDGREYYADEHSDSPPAAEESSAKLLG